MKDTSALSIESDSFSSLYSQIGENFCLTWFLKIFIFYIFIYIKQFIIIKLEAIIFYFY